MYAGKLLSVLVVALSTFSAAEAILIDPIFRTEDIQEIARRQREYAEEVIRRQRTGGGQATTPSSSDSPTASTPQPTSSTPKPTPTPQPTTPTSEPSRTPSPSPTPTSPSASASTPPPTTSKTTTTSQPSTDVTTTFSTVTQVITSTDPNGRQTTYTTEQVTAATAALANTQGSGQTGMSPQTRNTVIGVVVGIGGAIILAGIAFLVFRLYRKKAPEQDDGLMDYNSGHSPAEKSDVASGAGSQNGRSPFQSTLESYHAPTQVNTASNF